MKLYLREILKEANALGFGAPGQGGNSSDVALSNTAPGPSMQPVAPTMPQPQPGGMAQPNGMMLPQVPGLNPLGQQLQLGKPGFKTTL